jgi:methylthioribulose-1-phosphate dehydratase
MTKKIDLAETNQCAGSMNDLATLPEVLALQDLGCLFYHREWSLGTSGNFSVVLSREPFRLLITASGKDKRNLSLDDFLIVDADGSPIASSVDRPSAETQLHIAAARQTNVGSVLHTHSVWSTVLSDFYKGNGFFLEGYEMLKGFEGISTHKEKLWVEIFDNTQDITELSTRVSQRFVDRKNALKFGYIIRRHGLYAWGRDLNEARRHIEIFEFLFEVTGRLLGIDKSLAPHS